MYNFHKDNQDLIVYLFHEYVLRIRHVPGKKIEIPPSKVEQFNPTLHVRDVMYIKK